MAGVTTTLPLLKGAKGNTESGEGSCCKSSTNDNFDTSASGLCSCPIYPNKLLANLNSQRKNGKFCDIEIIADGTIFKVSLSNKYICTYKINLVFLFLKCVIQGLIVQLLALEIAMTLDIYV